MSLVRWRFSLPLGIVGAIVQGLSVALIAGSSTVVWILSILPYGLFLTAIPYLATTRRQRWWMSTATTLAVAWLLMFGLTLPAEYLGSVARYVVRSPAA